MIEMPCREFVERASDYLENLLSPEDLARLRAHLEDCPHCLEYLAQMRLTIRLAGRLRPSGDL